MDHAAHAAPAFLVALERSAFGALVRDHILLYPLANVLHVLGLAVFFAAVAGMDLRILGWFQGTPISETLRRLRPVALGAFLVMIASGVTLFVPEAAALGTNPAFQLKATAGLIALLNVLVFETGSARRLLALPAGAPTPWPARASAAASLSLWLLVAACGRAAAYL